MPLANNECSVGFVEQVSGLAARWRSQFVPCQPQHDSAGGSAREIRREVSSFWKPMRYCVDLVETPGGSLPLHAAACYRLLCAGFLVRRRAGFEVSPKCR